MLLVILFFTVIICSSAPLPCPSPEDRINAWYSGSYCYESYSCCFTEGIIDSNGNSTAMSCCYAYGTDGPYKCCGLNPYYPLFFLLLLIPVIGILFAITYICFMGHKQTEPVVKQEESGNIELDE